MVEDVLGNLSVAVVEGDTAKTIATIDVALKEGIQPNDILRMGLFPGIRKVGELFNAGEYYLPELIVSGKTMQAAVNHLNPFIDRKSSQKVGKYVIGTVTGDVHDIGKNIVIMMLRSNGWEVTDLGVDIAPEQFCEAVKAGDFDILGLSALLTTTMHVLDETIKALEDAKLRDRIKIMIGGAPVTQKYADKIGADAYGRDAWEAVTKAEALLPRKS
jgi:5-methyltetrahydrofolate--homocysteine methyltransferase